MRRATKKSPGFTTPEAMSFCFSRLSSLSSWPITRWPRQEIAALAICHSLLAPPLASGFTSRQLFDQDHHVSEEAAFHSRRLGRSSRLPDQGSRKPGLVWIFLAFSSSLLFVAAWADVTMVYFQHDRAMRKDLG
jgi:hypothetical protein